MSSPGFVKVDLDALAAIPAADRRPDLPIAVGAEDAWYIYKDAATGAEDRPNIVEPDDSVGRWFRMQATNADPGGGGGGAATIAVVSAPPTSTPSGAGDARAQNTGTTATYSTEYQDANFDVVTFDLDYRTTQRALWVANGSSASSWFRAAYTPSIIEYLNITDRFEQNFATGVYGNRAVALRAVFGVHPMFIGEILNEFFQAPDGTSFMQTYIAVGVPDDYWPDSNSYTPSTNPRIHWEPMGSGYQNTSGDWYN